MKQWFSRYWTLGNKGQQSLEKQGTNNCPAYCLGFHAIAQGMEPKQSPTDSLSGWDGSGADSLRRLRQLGSKDTIPEERAAQRENSRDLKRTFFGYSAEHWPVQAHEETNWGKGRTTQKIRGHRTQHSYRAKNSACSHQTDWKTSEFMEQWIEYSKRSCLSIMK